MFCHSVLFAAGLQLRNGSSSQVTYQRATAMALSEDAEAIRVLVFWTGGEGGHYHESDTFLALFGLARGKVSGLKKSQHKTKWTAWKSNAREKKETMRLVAL